jgi:hypothetical protein
VSRSLSLRTALAALVLVASLGSAAARAESITLPRAMPSFNQAYTSGPGAWGDGVLGTDGCPDRIRATGCLITAFSAVLSYYEIVLTIPAAYSTTAGREQGMDPRILNDWLRARHGYGGCSQDPLGSCCLEWSRLPKGVALSFHTNRNNAGLNPVAAVIIDHALRQGNPVIAGVHWSSACRSGSSQTEDCHWVVLTGKVGTTYTIVDPYNPDTTSPTGLRTTLDKGSRGNYTIDRFVVVSRTAGDPTLLNALPDPALPPPAVDPLPPPQPQPSAASTIAVLLVALALVAAAIFVVTKTTP